MTWSVGLSTVTGPDHLAHNVPGQDFSAFKKIDNDTVIAAVADGAGSAKHAAIGAKIAVETALKTIEKSDTDQLVDKVQKKLRSSAKEMDAELKDFACTLIALIAKPDSLTVFQVGDGFAVARFKEEYDLLLTPQKGDHVNETCFVTDKNAKKIMQKKQINKRPLFVSLATDGLENVALFYQNWKPYRGFFSPLDQYIKKTNSQNEAAQEIESFLNSPRLRAKNGDDKTLFVCGWQE